MDNKDEFIIGSQIDLKDYIDKLRKENNELKAKLNKYEEYGGIIDEGQAWADEAMASRELIKEIKEVVDLHYKNNKYLHRNCDIEQIKYLLSKNDLEI